MNGAIAPFSTHVQHENAKYRKAANSVGAWPVRRKFLKVVMAAAIQVGWKSNGRTSAKDAQAWTMGGGGGVAQRARRNPDGKA
jgi:hypothetical protein